MSVDRGRSEDIGSGSQGRDWTHFGPGAVKGAVSRHYSVDGTHEECCTAYVVGVPLLRRFETAVRSWAGAKGLDNIMLFGTPLEAQSPAAAPLI